MGTAYVVASGKGGTGKTSLVAGVGAALAAAGHRTLCIDADIGLRNLDIVLGMTDRVLMNFADVIEGRCTLEKAAAQHPQLQQLYLLTAPMSLSPGQIQAEQMRTLLQKVREQFAFCLLDAPAGIGSGFRAIIVTTTDSSSLRDAQRAVMELSEYPQLRSKHLVVNRVEKRLLRKLHRNIDDAIDTAGLPLLGVVPEDDALPLAQSRGTALLLVSHTGASAAYRNIAKRITGQRVPLLRLR